MTNFALPSHVSKRWVVSVEASTGEVLSPADFEFFGAATAPGAGAVAMRSTPGESQTVLTLSPLGQAGTWHYSIFCRQKRTAVTWQVDSGQISVTPSPCLAQPSLDPDPVLLSAMLDPQTLQVTVSLGDSVAATAAAAQQATQSAANAEAAQTQAAQAADDAQTSQAAAAQSAANAEAAQTQAAQAAADAQTSQAAAAQSAANAEAAQTQAAQAAADAQTSQAAAAQSAANAEAAQTQAAQAADDAQTSQAAAAQSAANAEAAQTQAAQAADDAQTSQAAAAQSAANAEAAQTQAAQEASKAEVAQTKAEQASAEVAEVSWARGFPVFEWQIDAPDEVQLDQLAAFWNMKNVAVLCKGRTNDGQPSKVLNSAFSQMGAAAWVNIVFKVEQRLRSLGYFSKQAPSVENCFYMAGGAGNNGQFDFANALYYKATLKEANWGGFGTCKCRAFEVTTIDAAMDTTYFGMDVKNNVFRKYGNLGSNVLRICRSVDDALRVVLVPDGTWEKAVDARFAYSGAKSLPERYVPDALPKLVRGGSMFQNCNLSAEKSISILNSLQQNKGSTVAGDWQITMGMHVDHQADEELRAAIDAAVARGWTVSEQWNGTATASTFALRPAPPLPVYARIDSFADAEGNEQRSLSWCHQITSPDGKEPEELGYTMFESVDAAREYFGLPEEESQPTK